MNDNTLAGRKFIAGENPTIADCFAYGELDQLKAFPDDYNVSADTSF